MIYQLVNKRTKILAIATTNVAHFCNLYYHVFTLLICMPRFNSIKFYQNRPKIKLVFVKNRQNFRALGALPLDPRNSPPFPLQISGYAPESNHVFALLIFMPPEFPLMPDLKSINFYQNKTKIKLFLQKK